MFEYLTNIKCRGLRYPKVFQYKDKQYLFGSKQYEHQNDITKYGLYVIQMAVKNGALIKRIKDNVLIKNNALINVVLINVVLINVALIKG